ncbi:MAG TPA: DoxX family protein [Chitinophagaceae bacterium]|nr:DoxX family protein [Chitinophagaceae bacterium]
MKKIFSLNNLDPDLSALLLRLILGGLFIYHGYFCIEHMNEYRPLSQPIIGIPGKLAYDLLMVFQLGCGILLCLGFLTRLAVLPITFMMVVAFFVAHKKDTFQVKELAFAYMLLSVVVFIMGSGKYSLDALLFKKRGTVN